jgi:hypothetical protein
VVTRGRSATIALAVLIGLLVLTAVACFNLTPADGSIQCSDDPGRRCPSGYLCISDRCWQRPPDLGISHGGASD